VKHKERRDKSVITMVQSKWKSTYQD
jgi:hypothetical protein